MKEFKGFRRGVNLGGWMSQCDYSKDRLDNFITEPDFAKIASWRLDHVRLPFDYNIVETENGDAYIEDGFRRIGEAIRLSRKYGLNIILDLHKTCGFSFDKGETQFGLFDDPALQERFCRLWEQMARRFGNDPEHVAFELLNEVTEQEYSKKWNELAKKCIGRIRAFAPDTVILVGSYWNNHATAVKDMDPPYDDKIVYNFHSYDPLPFTHQGAHWVDSLDINARVPFEESGATEAFFEDLFAEAVKIAEERGTVLYCGEYGVIDVAEPGDVLKWYGTINAVFEKHDIGRAAWTYRAMDFEMCGDRLAGVIGELVKVM